MSAQRQDQGIESAGGFHILFYLVDCFAYPHELLFRKPGTMGPEYPGWPIRIGALCALPLFLARSPPHYGHQYVLTWWQLIFGMMVVHGIASFWYRYEHSQYIGDSWAWSIFKGTREKDARIIPEFAMALVLAVPLIFICDTLANFVIVSSVCNAISLVLLNMRTRRVVQKMRNQQVEAEMYADKFNNPGGHL